MQEPGADLTARIRAWEATGPGRTRSLIERVRASLAWKLGLTAGVLYVLTLAWELISEEEPLSFGVVVEEMVDRGLVIGFGTAVAIVVLNRLSSHESELADLRGDLEAARAQGGAWRDKVRDQMAGLALAVQQQFRDWGLTDAEQDIAFLLLKGLSLKEIATVRETSEGTVRQQAAGIYRKSGLEGRSALAAFFFEDMLAPPGQANGGPSAR